MLLARFIDRGKEDDTKGNTGDLGVAYRLRFLCVHVGWIRGPLGRVFFSFLFLFCLLWSYISKHLVFIVLTFSIIFRFVGLVLSLIAFCWFYQDFLSCGRG